MTPSFCTDIQISSCEEKTPSWVHTHTYTYVHIVKKKNFRYAHVPPSVTETEGGHLEDWWVGILAI